MGLFEKKAYRRADSLERASRAAARGDRAAAIVEYRKVLEHEPDDDMVLTRLGELLAQTGQRDEARELLVRAAHGFEKRGFDDKAVAAYSLALVHLPGDVELVLCIADKHVAHRRNAQAVKTLLDGRGKLRRRRDRAAAIQLLRRAIEIEPAHAGAALDLALVLCGTGERAEARALLDGLAAAATGPTLRRVRGAQFRVSPSPITAWRWLRGS